MNNRLDVKTAISLMSSSWNNEMDKLNVAYGNYMIAKKNCDPFMVDVKDGLANINKIYEEAGMDKPFILGYADLKADLAKKQANIKDVEAKRDAARANFLSIDEDIKKYPGLTYAEVQERREKAKVDWDKYNEEVSNAWYSFREAEARQKDVKEDEFDAKCNTYEYLKELVEGKRGELLSTFVNDERTSNNVKKELYGIEIALDSLDRKQGVIKESIKVFEEISQKLGIELIYDEGKVIGIKNDKKVDEPNLDSAAPNKEDPEPKREVKPSEEKDPKELADPNNKQPEDLAPDRNQEPDNTPEKDSKPEKDNSKIKPGEKHKVIRIRKAHLKRFVNYALIGGAIGSVGLGAISLWNAALGGGIGIGVAALWNIISIEREFYKENKEELNLEGPVGVVSACKTLIASYRAIMAERRQKTQEPTPSLEDNAEKDMEKNSEKELSPSKDPENLDDFEESMHEAMGRGR